ncbi:hypothetical protein MXD59_20250 [Frankia sp. Ag45/Mut15]|uniref:Secreted protein n=1 Tax=Frankia umida TaxID=573489 RepID=A0ABT0K2S1_9ACTN|nr:hypothetical protein [Frankia umida]MCK9878074.1 hypothetical protein [Frankia umida]
MPLAIVLALAVGAGAVGVLVLSGSDKGPASAVRSYLADVRAARYDAAYGRLCATVRGTRSQREYSTIMRAFDGVRGTVASYAVRTVQTVHPSAAETVREVQVDVQRSGGSASRESYDVHKESGGYCLLTAGSPFSLGSGGGPPDTGGSGGSGGPGTGTDPFGGGGSGGGSGGQSDGDASVHAA